MKLLLRRQHPRKLRFLARGEVWMHDPLRRSLVELADDGLELGLHRVRVAGLDRIQELFDLSLDCLLGGAVAQPAILVLTVPFLGAAGVRHYFSPTLYRTKSITSNLAALSKSPTVFLPYFIWLAIGWSTSTFSESQVLYLPSAIFSTMLAGLPTACSSACCRASVFSRSTTSLDSASAVA